MTHDVAKFAARRAQHAQSPAWLGSDIDDVRNREFGRCRQTIFQIFVALSQNLQIERQDQGFAISGFGSVNQALDKATVFHHVQLKPKAFASVFGNVFDRTNAHRGERKRDSHFVGSARGQDFAIGVLHASHAGRSDSNRHCCCLANHVGRSISTFHIDSNTLAQFDFLEITFVRFVSALRPTARISVVIKHAGHTFLRENA